MIKTAQFQHQREVYETHKDKDYFALFWEMGLGKTKLILDVAAHHWAENRIKALIVLAPNSVYKNWTLQEAPIHFAPDHVSLAYPKGQSGKAWVMREIFGNPAYKPELMRLLCTSYDSICTEHGYDYLMRFVMMFPSMIVADESTVIKQHKTKRAERAKEAALAAQYRWIATGTPVAQSPFDIHSQMEFLEPSFWESFGLATITAFKAQFSNLGLQRERGRTFYQVNGYKNLNTLNKIISPVSSRLLKEDSGVELPPKLYSTKTFELTKEQMEVYEKLRKTYMAEFESGAYVEAPLAIVRLTRLQQLTCGFLTVKENDSDDDIAGQMFPKTKEYILDVVKPEKNPRLQLLLELIEECSHKMIVWCRFRHDVDTITQSLGSRSLRYDGTTSSKQRTIVLDRFRNPNDRAQVLVANIAAMAYGVTLTIAKTIVYYSNSYSLEKRLQSEDRNHRIGQDSPVLIIDLAAEDTVDARVIQSLRQKYDVAAQVTGDVLREWLEPPT